MDTAPCVRFTNPWIHGLVRPGGGRPGNARLARCRWPRPRNPPPQVEAFWWAARPPDRHASIVNDRRFHIDKLPMRSNRPPNPHVPIETNRMANTAPPESDNIVVASRHGLDLSID